MTYYPDQPVREGDYFDRAAYIGRLGCWSDDLFDLVAESDEWMGEVQVQVG